MPAVDMKAIAPDAALLQGLAVCPVCHGALSWTDAAARCAVCAHTYPIVDGIPVLLRDGTSAEHDELEHLHVHGGSHKNGQAEYFDRAHAVEFETVRPHNTPELHQWLLGEKFRRSIAGIDNCLCGAIVLTVCGGSGMDAEFLARAGAQVILSDISLGAAQRARERARRFGLAITPLVADVEHLPFRERAVDVVYVHDGLHHLEDPWAGLREMARVAGRAISITEPAQAALTDAAVRLGLALEREEAGNLVVRLSPVRVRHELQVSGFDVTHLERYAMYYKHEPGTLTRVFSSRGVLPIAQGAYHLIDTAFGRFGNKLTVQAQRLPRAPKRGTLAWTGS